MATLQDGYLDVWSVVFSAIPLKMTIQKETNDTFQVSRNSELQARDNTLLAWFASSTLIPVG